ncbi:MAG: hypothetical protein QGH46_07595 [Gammaproteobacteria bacterium]|nr:hypothetical protein [Gammaproteobacteria bacterium]
MFKKGLVLFAVLSLYGCLQILPDDTIKDTFSAGKRMYDESKLKQNGGEKISFSTQVVLDNSAGKNETERECIGQLRKKLSQESTKKEAVILAENFHLVQSQDSPLVKCEISAYLWR